MKLLSRLFKILSKIRLPKFRLLSSKRKVQSKTRKYKIKGNGGWKFGGWNLREQPGLPVRVNKKSKTKRK